MFFGHPRSPNWTLDFEPAFSPRFSPTLSPRSFFHTLSKGTLILSKGTLILSKGTLIKRNIRTPPKGTLQPASDNVLTFGHLDFPWFGTHLQDRFGGFPHRKFLWSLAGSRHLQGKFLSSLDRSRHLQGKFLWSLDRSRHLQGKFLWSLDRSPPIRSHRTFKTYPYGYQ